jgi:hypothetical protein
VVPLSLPHPVTTSTHHRSARRRPAWLFFFLLLSSPHSPRLCRVAGPSAAVLAKVLPCATSLPSVRVCSEPPRFNSIRRISVLPTPRAATPPRACATYSSAYRACQTRVFTLQLSRPASPVFPRLVHSRASMHQRPLCSATHVLLDPCGHITSLRSCPRHSRTDALLPLRCASTLVRPTPASQRRPLA